MSNDAAHNIAAQITDLRETAEEMIADADSMRLAAMADADTSDNWLDAMMDDAPAEDVSGNMHQREMQELRDRLAYEEGECAACRGTEDEHHPGCPMPPVIAEREHLRKLLAEERGNVAKLGRPSIPEADKRKLQRIFSANEFARVKAKAAAAGMTAAAWVRAKVRD